jgi:hypothetical protein
MTIRQQLLQGLADYLQGQQDFPALVGRSLARAFGADEGTQLVVHRGGESPDLDIDGDGQRYCDALISVVTRSDEAEVDADAVMDIAHPLVMGFTDPRLVLIEEIKVDEPKYASADYRVCVITTHYRFSYQVQNYGI